LYLLKSLAHFINNVFIGFREQLSQVQSTNFAISSSAQYKNA